MQRVGPRGSREQQHEKEGIKKRKGRKEEKQKYSNIHSVNPVNSVKSAIRSFDYLVIWLFRCSLKNPLKILSIWNPNSSKIYVKLGLKRFGRSLGRHKWSPRLRRPTDAQPNLGYQQFYRFSKLNLTFKDCWEPGWIARGSKNMM